MTNVRQCLTLTGISIIVCVIIGADSSREEIDAMIRSFRNRSLKRYWEKRDASRLPPERLKRIKLVLDALDGAVRPEQLDLPGLDFHRLVADQKGRYSVMVSRNWQITFEWDGEDAIDVDFEDYH